MELNNILLKKQRVKEDIKKKIKYLETWKWKHNIWKLEGYSGGSSKREVYNDKMSTLKTKIPNKQPNFTSQETRKLCPKLEKGRKKQRPEQK